MCTQSMKRTHGWQPATEGTQHHSPIDIQPWCSENLGWATPRPIAVRPDRAAKRLKSQTNQLQPTALVVGW